MTSLAIVGPGRMGLALGDVLARSGAFDTIVVHGRRPEPPAHPFFDRPGVRYVFGLEPLPANCGAVLLAVPDAAVAEVAHAVASQGTAPEGCAAFHLSGAMPSDVLAPLHAQGYAVGVFHPWVTTPLQAHRRNIFDGAAIGVTASPEATRTARDLAGLLDAVVVPVPAGRRVYADAAVAMVGTYLPVLLDAAVPALGDVGLDADEAIAALVPLARSILDELEVSGVSETLRSALQRSGPGALSMHLRALEGDERRLYAWMDWEARVRAGIAPDEGGHPAFAHPFDEALGD